MRLDPDRIPPLLGRILIELLGSSWRVDYLRPLSGRSGRVRVGNVLYAFWHGRQLPLIYTHRHEGITVMVSEHRDGQYVTNVLHANGFGTIRGSTTRGGHRAMRRMVRAIRSGLDGAITPDGPRGPARTLKPGTPRIAAMAGRPVVCMSASAWPRVRFDSWDRFILPLPFSRVAVVEGRPLAVGRGRPDRIEAELRRVTGMADLAALPGPRLQAWALSLLARSVSPIASAALAFRPARERGERRGRARPRADGPIWLHGSSLGELKGLLPVVEMLSGKGIPVHVSCSTPAGRSFLEGEGLPASFAPLDVPGWVERFLRRIRPRALVLSETELWPNMLLGSIRFGIPMAMINAKLSSRSLKRYSIIRRLLSTLLSTFVGIMTRTTEDLERFSALGVDPEVLEVGGDTKILRAPPKPPQSWMALADCRRPVLVAGSTREGEEETVVKAASESAVFPLIAPRHIRRANRVLKMLRGVGMRPVPWSSLDPGWPDPGDADSIVVDVHGVLDSLYGIADVAFVGGTLVDIGGHNLMEPLHHGVPVMVGPSVESYADTVSRGKRSGTIVTVEDATSMSSAMNRLLQSPPDRKAVSELVGSESDRILGKLWRLLDIAYIGMETP
ncbi:DUF374 domain-containing protein [Candidatus Fermentibacteria bacterium]|nr:DUF374 domain-containing protein [Candidatus Fermentibacteria bacterium]